jgi:hypothetical protein
MYAKTTLDDDFLVNTSLEKVNNKIQGYIRIRSQSKGLILNLGETLKQIQIVWLFSSLINICISASSSSYLIIE